MPRAKIETTSALILSLWKGGQPGLSKRGEGGNQLEGVGHRLRACGGGNHLHGPQSEWASQISQLDGAPAMATIMKSLWRAMCQVQCEHSLYIISVNPPQEECSPCTLYK